jgi:hypothetical protein
MLVINAQGMLNTQCSIFNIQISAPEERIKTGNKKLVGEQFTQLFKVGRV